MTDRHRIQIAYAAANSYYCGRFGRTLQRAEWEQNRRANYWHAAYERINRRPLSDWLSPEEIDQAMTGIRERWKECGRQMRRTTDQGERRNLWYERRCLNEPAIGAAICPATRFAS